MKRGEIYPSWRYHADGRSVLCVTADQDAVLGDEWSDADIRQPQADPEPAPEPEAAPVPARRRRRLVN